MYNNPNIFLEKLFKNLSNFELNISNYVIDHIAFRCSDLLEYEKQKEYYSTIWKLYSENIVNWRPISVFVLNISILFLNYKISVIELISPKVWKTENSWFEHIEFVINEDLDEFVFKNSNCSFVKKYEKINNKEIELYIWDWINIKFHNKTLLEAIDIQNITWIL